MPVTFSSYRLGPGQRVSNKTVPPPWDWLLRRENELGPRRSKSRIIFAVLVPPLYVAVQAPALIVTIPSLIDYFVFSRFYLRNTWLLFGSFLPSKPTRYQFILGPFLVEFFKLYASFFNRYILKKIFRKCILKI